MSAEVRHPMAVTTIQRPSRTAPANGGGEPRRWTRAEYYRAYEAGVFGPEERLELLNGEIIRKMSPQLGLHAGSVSSTSRILGRIFEQGHVVRTQLPLILSDQSEPEPDLVVVAGGDFDWGREHPTATDALLVVEVADTTVRFDRGRKRTAYARAGVREYWIVNLPERCVEVYRHPSRGRFQESAVHGEDAVVTPLAAPEAAIRVSDLLPPAALLG